MTLFRLFVADGYWEAGVEITGAGVELGAKAPLLGTTTAGWPGAPS